MKARKLAVEAIAEVVERTKKARELSVAEVEQVGGGLARKSAIIVFDYEGAAVNV